MKRTGRAAEKRGAALRAWLGLLVLLAVALPAMARVEVDFNPNLDFSQFKTYAYIGGVEHLVMMQLNPELINDRVHRAVQRELNKKGLREVQPTKIQTSWCATGQAARCSSTLPPQATGVLMALI